MEGLEDEILPAIAIAAVSLLSPSLLFEAGSADLVEPTLAQSSFPARCEHSDCIDLSLSFEQEKEVVH